MKRILSFILSLTLVCAICVSMSVTAFAAESPVSINVNKSGSTISLDVSVDFYDEVDLSGLEIEVVTDTESDYNIFCDSASVQANVEPFYTTLTSSFASDIQKSDGKTHIKMSFPGSGVISDGKFSAAIRVCHSSWTTITENATYRVSLGGKEIYPQYNPNSEDITAGGENAQFSVKSTYQAGTQADTVYSVDVAWGSMEFTYSGGSDGTWNPLTHEYENVQTAGWSSKPDSNKITVTNRSNTAINAGLSYTKAEGFDLTAAFANSENAPITKLSLPTAASYGETLSGPRTDAAYMNIASGTLASGTAAKTTLGTITVTISDAE